MTAVSPHGAPLGLPFSVGQLRVTGVTLEGRKRTDTFDVTSGPAGDVGFVIIDRGSPRSEPDGLVRRLVELTERGFTERTPLHAIMLDLVRGLLDSPSTELGVTLVRCSAAEARVEITTAGMPPVACVPPSGPLTLHAVAAPRLRATTSSPPPVEFVPLVWGSSWLAISDGFAAESDASASVCALAAALELGEAGVALSQEPPVMLAKLLGARVAASARRPDEDATLVLLAADASPRFRSGVQRGA